MKTFLRCSALASILFAASCSVGADVETDESSGTLRAPAPVEHVLLARTTLFNGVRFEAASATPDSPTGGTGRAAWVVTANAELITMSTPASPVDANGETVVALSGSLGIGGTFHLEIDGYPAYDGPIPGLAEIEIPFEAASASEPDAIDHVVEAALTHTALKPIALPAGLPGSLVVTIGEGSHLAANVLGALATSPEEATESELDTAGHVTLHAKIVVPGQDEILIAPITVPLALPDRATMPSPAPVLYTLISSAIYLLLTYGRYAKSDCAQLACELDSSLPNVATCGACSIASGGPCQSTAQWCADDADCGALWQCLEDCPADIPSTLANEYIDCAAVSLSGGCVKSHPLGFPKYLKLLTCMYWQTCLCD